MSKTNITISCLLAVYFLFTFGVVFALTDAPIDKFDVPFSFMLSHDMGIVGIATDDDVVCAEWLAEHTDGNSPIYADINGFLLLAGYLEPYHQLQEVFAWQHETVNVPDDAYLFLTEWNVKHRMMVYHFGQAGLRVYAPLPKELWSKPIVYQKGLARIYK